MMILHYIKMAIRNLRKYALQNTVSILGLAAGFVALSLSAYWYTYDNTYDKFHKDWERIYLVSGDYQRNISYKSGYTDNADGDRMLSGKKFTFSPINKEGTIKTLTEMPETESLVSCYPILSNVLAIGPEFFNTMGYEIIKGDTSFLEKPDYCAISESFARKYYGKKDPTGENIFLLELEHDIKNEINNCHNNTSSNCIVGAVYRGESHSYLDFDIMVNAPKILESDTYGGSINKSIKNFLGQNNVTFVKLRPGVDSKDYEEKAVSYNSQGKNNVSKIELCNISKLNSKYDAGPMDIKQLRVFAFISLLLVICSLVNCITLFVSRISGRRKEMGLRLSNGSSFSDLLSLLSIELILQFLIALLFAVCLVFFIKGKFSEYAQIDVDTMYILWSCLLIMVLVLLLFVAVGLVTLAIVLKGSLSSTMVINRSLNKTIRRSGLSIQLFISISCLFCSLSMFHQLTFLRNTNWGFGTRGAAHITFIPRLETVSSAEPNGKEGENGSDTGFNMFNMVMVKPSTEFKYKLIDSIKQIPGVIDADITDNSFVDYSCFGSYMFASPNPDGEKITALDLCIYDIGNEAYGFNVIEGSLPEEKLAPDEIVITESVCRAFGLENPIGKKLYRKFIWNDSDSFNGSGFSIVAVISDLYLKGPFVAPDSLVFFAEGLSAKYDNSDFILVRYQNDIHKELSELTYSMCTDYMFTVTYMEDWFEGFLKPSKDLFRLFTIIAIICMLISVFGVWSIITLTCQERRREIAVRKVHGAKVRDILTIFVREYGAVLLMTSVVAFGVGYVVMHKWIQQFQKQAVISWWIYAVILVGMAAIISLTVVQRIVKTARENPADVIKSE